MNRSRTAVIIPAYNEESTVGAVVRAAKGSPLVDEVLVVSDGSTDRTKERAGTAGARVLQLPSKGGKGQAMLYGLAHTDAPVVVFLDADLKGLRAEHLERLVLPVVEGSFVMTVGIRDRGSVLSGITRFLPLVGGERAMLRRVIEGIDPGFLQGFMVESALNYHCKANGWDYGPIFLPGLGIRRKTEKVGFFRGVVEYLKMWKQVAKAMLAVRIARARHEFPEPYAD